MERTLYFRQMFYDSQDIGAKNQCSFFSESDDNDESIRSVEERDAVKWLFQSLGFEQFFVEAFFTTPSLVRHFFEVKQPLTEPSQKPGDIDLLLVDPACPHQAIAFECKRVKITSQRENIFNVTGAKGIIKGVEQANAYQSLGFHQSYLMVILLDDARDNETPNALLRANKSEYVSEVYNLPWNAPLHEDIGIIFVKITQPSGIHYSQRAGIGYCIDKPAKHLEQSAKMTEKIKAFLRHMAS